MRDIHSIFYQFYRMASIYLSLHYHIVFGTKDRMSLIAPEWRSRLHEYLAGTVVGLGGVSEATGGIADHVHLLVRLKATHRLSDFVRDLKKSSAVWIRENVAEARNFSWQTGYAAFSVSSTSSEAVENYILN